MLSEEVIGRFKKGEVVLHCPTQEVYNKTIEELAAREIHWYPKRVWNRDKESTCLYRNSGDYQHSYLEFYRKFWADIGILSLTLDDFNEAQQDLETLRSLFKKYHVCLAGNLEEAIEKATKKEMGNI